MSDLFTAIHEHGPQWVAGLIVAAGGVVCVLVLAVCAFGASKSAYRR